MDFIHEFKFSIENNFYAKSAENYCLRCCFSLEYIAWQVSKMPEAFGEFMSITTLNKFFPCISDAQFNMKCILK